MQRSAQLLFLASFLGLCWLGMMAVHEFGHCLGAWLTGGKVQQVVLHPLKISRTDVAPNPQPGIVVWLGPLVGCLLPVALALGLTRRLLVTKNLALFFAGFCLVANGSYIAAGSFGHIGDAGVMLQNGSPRWLLIAFGLITIPLGFLIWHRLGSLQQFLSDPELIEAKTPCAVFILLLLLVTLELSIFAN